MDNNFSNFFKKKTKRFDDNEEDKEKIEIKINPIEIEPKLNKSNLIIYNFFLEIINKMEKFLEKDIGKNDIIKRQRKENEEFGKIYKKAKKELEYKKGLEEAERKVKKVYEGMEKERKKNKKN